MAARIFKTKQDVEQMERDNRKEYHNLEEQEKEIATLQMKYQDLALSLKRELDKIADYVTGPAVAAFLDTKNKALVEDTQSFHDGLINYKKEIQTQKRKLDERYNDLLKELKTYEKEDRHENSSE